MALGGIKHCGKTNFVIIRDQMNAPVYWDTVKAIPVIKHHQEYMVYRQENAHPHTEYQGPHSQKC